MTFTREWREKKGLQKNLDLDSENTWLSRNLSKFASWSFKNKPKTQLERQMINRKGFREAGCYRRGRGKSNYEEDRTVCLLLRTFLYEYLSTSLRFITPHLHSPLIYRSPGPRLSPLTSPTIKIISLLTSLNIFLIVTSLSRVASFCLWRKHPSIFFFFS